MSVAVFGSGYRPGPAAGERFAYVEPRLSRRDGTCGAVIALPGRGADCRVWLPHRFEQGRHAAVLAERYTLLTVDAGGPRAWSGRDALRAVTDAYRYATETLKAAPRVGLMGWSMGGLTALNWMARNRDLVAGCVLWTPSTDIRYFYRVDSEYASEIEAVYGRRRWSRRVAAHCPARDPGTFRSSPPTRIYVGEADEVVPPSQSAELVAGARNPSWERIVLPGAGHSNLFGFVDPRQVVDFFAGCGL
jgi:alpha-beta hydrolase superfamily lysophospholipase